MRCGMLFVGLVGCVRMVMMVQRGVGIPKGLDG